MNFDISYSGNVLTLIPGETLLRNSQYTVTILKGVSGVLPPSGTTVNVIETDYTFWFTTQYCPLFSTPNRVKLQVGPLADNVIDDTIYRMIYKNSIDAVDLYCLSNSTTMNYDYWGCLPSGVPMIFRRYVECKTAYDILSIMRVTQAMSGGTGGQLKTLGDMTINYGGATTTVDPKRLTELYTCWNESLRMFRNTSTTVKGYYDNTKGYQHPVLSYTTNRVIKPVIPFQGNYTPGDLYWRTI